MNLASFVEKITFVSSRHIYIQQLVKTRKGNKYRISFQITTKSAIPSKLNLKGELNYGLDICQDVMTEPTWDFNVDIQTSSRNGLLNSELQSFIDAGN
jgi:hypothetical protein